VRVTQKHDDIVCGADHRHDCLGGTGNGKWRGEHCFRINLRRRFVADRLLCSQNGFNNLAESICLCRLATLSVMIG